MILWSVKSRLSKTIADVETHPPSKVDNVTVRAACLRGLVASRTGKICHGFTNGVSIPRFYQPDLQAPTVHLRGTAAISSSVGPIGSIWRTLVMVMIKGTGANLTNDEKRAHLIDIRREHLIDQVCPQEILPPEK
jgi:hypothetical protein